LSTEGAPENSLGWSAPKPQRGPLLVVLVLVLVLVLELVVMLSLPNEALAKLGARPIGLLRHNESRFSCNNFVRSVSRWNIQLLEDEHEHGFSISEFRLNEYESERDNFCLLTSALI
jgi:hypothetical protein